jgi:hypothetical protein
VQFFTLSKPSEPTESLPLDEFTCERVWNQTTFMSRPDRPANSWTFLSAFSPYVWDDAIVRCSTSLRAFRALKYVDFAPAALVGQLTCAVCAPDMSFLRGTDSMGSSRLVQHRGRAHALVSDDLPRELCSVDRERCVSRRARR